MRSRAARPKGSGLEQFGFFTGLAARFPGDTECMSPAIQQGLEVLYSREQIAQRVVEMGAQITRDLNGEKLVMVGVLKGAAIFLSDLARAVDADATFDFVAVSSYGKGQRSSGAVKLIKDLDEPIEGKNVLIVEDILDTGLTLSFLRKVFLQHHPKSLRIATLLDKPSRRIEQIDADYVGFSIPNLFVIGYGMDYAERYRNLPDICLMAPTQAE
jgi:hypoxanthine phosphoribosyltransferase